MQRLLSIIVILATLSALMAFQPKRSTVSSSSKYSRTNLNSTPNTIGDSNDNSLEDDNLLAVSSIGITSGNKKSPPLSIRGGASFGGLDALVRGFKARMAYDSSFVTKIAVELFVGFTTQVAAEIAKRGSNSLAEIDFIIADIIMGLTANFAAVYLSAPYGGTPSSTAGLSPLNKFILSCPDNAFQTVAPNSARYTIIQRIFAIVKAAPKLFIIGFGAMAVGSGLTGSLAAVRGIVSGGSAVASVSPDALIHLVKISSAIGLYLAVSTNLRYQFVAGILEERVIDPVFKARFPSPLLQGLCSGLVRTCNTFLGSAMMIDYLKAMGLQ